MAASASGIIAGKAFVIIEALDKTSRVFTSISNKLDKLGKSYVQMGQKLIRTSTLIGTAVGGMLGLVTKLSSDFQETINKFNVVFKDSAGEIRRWGENFGKVIGRSKQQTLDFLADARSFLASRGFESGLANTMSMLVNQFAVDTASLLNVADTRAFSAIRNTMLGRPQQLTTMGGPTVQVADVKIEAKRLGFNPEKLTEQQKVMIRLTLAVNRFEQAWGDALRTSKFFENTLKRLKAEISDTALTVGQKLIPAGTKLLNLLLKFTKQVAPIVINNIVKFGVAVTGVVTVIATAGVTLFLFGKSLLLIAAAMKGVVFIFGVGTGIFKAVGIVIAAVSWTFGIALIAMKVFAGILSTIGLVTTALTTTMLGLSSLGAGMSAVISVITALELGLAGLSIAFAGNLVTVGLVIAAAFLLKASWETLIETFFRVASSLKRRGREITETATNTFQLVSRAIEEGDIEAAWDALFLGMTITFLQFKNTLLDGMDEIKAIFDKLKGYYDDIKFTYDLLGYIYILRKSKELADRMRNSVEGLFDGRDNLPVVGKGKRGTKFMKEGFIPIIEEESTVTTERGGKGPKFKKEETLREVRDRELANLVKQQNKKIDELANKKFWDEFIESRIKLHPLMADELRKLQLLPDPSSLLMGPQQPDYTDTENLLTVLEKQLGKESVAYQALEKLREEAEEAAAELEKLKEEAEREAEKAKEEFERIMEGLPDLRKRLEGKEGIKPIVAAEKGSQEAFRKLVESRNIDQKQLDILKEIRDLEKDQLKVQEKGFDVFGPIPGFRNGDNI